MAAFLSYHYAKNWGFLTVNEQYKKPGRRLLLFLFAKKGGVPPWLQNAPADSVSNTYKSCSFAMHSLLHICRHLTFPHTKMMNAQT